MKRGLITWDKAELPPSAFDQRLALVRKHLTDLNLPALAVYTDVWRSNQGRYLTNFMPYWNRALIVIPREGAPVLLCALSPRVYPWIRSVTILDEIRPSQNLAQALTKMCEENGWSNVGVLDLALLPFDLNVPNSVDVPWSAIHPQPDEAELNMYRSAAKLARKALVNLKAGLDHEVISELERTLRREGAEDLVILVTNGDTPPLPPTGATLGTQSSISIALEYRGHWVKVGQPILAAAGFPAGSPTCKTELLSGPYPYEPVLPPAIKPGSLFASTTESQVNGARLFQTETRLQGLNGPELL